MRIWTVPSSSFIRFVIRDTSSFLETSACTNNATATASLYLFGYAVGLCFSLSVVDGHSGTFFCQCEGNCLPNSAAGAGYQGDLSASGLLFSVIFTPSQMILKRLNIEFTCRPTPSQVPTVLRSQATVPDYAPAEVQRLVRLNLLHSAT